MTSSRELETRHYWRTMRDLKNQRDSGTPISELADNLDEIDVLANATSSTRLRALCLAALTTVSSATASTAATLVHDGNVSNVICRAAALAAQIIGLS